MTNVTIALKYKESGYRENLQLLELKFGKYPCNTDRLPTCWRTQLAYVIMCVDTGIFLPAWNNGPVAQLLLIQYCKGLL